jgi:spore maturation protein CgeB
MPTRDTKHHDVVFLGNSHYDFRIELGKTLRSIKNHNVGLYGNWPKSYHPDGFNLYDYNAGTKIYKAAKIAISDSRPNAGGFVSNRLFQAMVAGCFVIQQKFTGMTELNGLTDGMHLVTYEKTSELPDLIDYWLNPNNTERRKRIAVVGQDYVERFCSFDKRVSELMVWLGELY